jgi:hypothetical protein
MKIAIIRYTEGTGRTYIVDITTDPDKWLVDNNSTRDKEEYEKLSDFDIEWTTLKHYVNQFGYMGSNRIKLIEKLIHYYEVDIDNCKMSHEMWIEELAKAMSDKNYKDNFLKEHKDYVKFLNE